MTDKEYIDYFDEHFKPHEYACQCGCGYNTIAPGLKIIMAKTRIHFGKPTTFTSGCRCKEHNRVVNKDAIAKKGGDTTNVDRTQHLAEWATSTHDVIDLDNLECKAADFKVEDTHPDDVSDYLEKEYPNTCGIGKYNGRTHVDCRFKKARWDYRS